MVIELKAAHFCPGKKNYERIKWCLTSRMNLNFDIIMAWDPPGKLFNSYLIIMIIKWINGLNIFYLIRY